MDRIARSRARTRTHARTHARANTRNTVASTARRISALPRAAEHPVVRRYSSRRYSRVSRTATTTNAGARECPSGHHRPSYRFSRFPAAPLVGRVPRKRPPRHHDFRSGFRRPAVAGLATGHRRVHPEEDQREQPKGKSDSTAES